MKIYNTYSKKLEDINLKEKIGLYVCGITPYDTTHLGHAFTFIIYDSLVRYLRFLGAKVTYVQNVTDIDDDILIRANSLKTSWKKLGEDETTKHLKNMQNIGALKPDYYPKATENITEMIKIIKKLIVKKLVYVSGGSVYFDVKKDKNFGKLSGFGYPSMLEISNERGNYPLDKHKKDPLDFVLWQKRHDKEPFWKSPWGDGRPGWHIECSAMSMRFLGKTITIHGGGTDLIFPHHEAEISQSENYTNQKFVKTWMHVGMVYYEGKKMSKSLGNMIFVDELLKKYDKNTIRIYLLKHHYRSPWEFDISEIENCKKLSEMFKKNIQKGTNSKKEILHRNPKFFDLLNDDFKTNEAIDLLSTLTKTKKLNGKLLFDSLRTIGINY